MDARSNIVSLYRKLKNVEFNSENDSFSGSCIIDESCIALLKSIDSSFPNTIYSIQRGKSRFTVEDIVPSKISTKIIYTLPESIFFNNAALFIEKKGVKANGNLDFYYLIEEDYQSGDTTEPEVIKNLKSIFEVIGFLSDVLPHTEKGLSTTTFVYFPEDKNGNIKTKRTVESVFNQNDVNANLKSFFKLKNTISQDDCHRPERVAVFRNSLAELLSAEAFVDSTFSHLLQNFDKLYEIYKDNYDTYINGFSLEKIKKEITDYHQQFSKAISDGMNEIISKSLAIPASIAAGALLMKSNTITGDLLMLAVLLLTAIITSMLLSWQKNSINDNKSLIEKAFSSFTKDTRVTEAARNFSTQTMENLLSKADGVKTRLHWMLTIAWLPVTIGSCYLFVKYSIEQKAFYVFDIFKHFILHLITD